MMYLGRTDLAVELREGLEEFQGEAKTEKKQAEEKEGEGNVREQGCIEGVEVSTKVYAEEDITETVIHVKTKQGAEKLGKPEGTYITIESRSLECMDVSYHEPMMQILKKHLAVYLQGHFHVLIAGLGNRMVTPDALGPMVVENLCITRHLIQENVIAAKFMYSAISPGVMAQTGMETGELLRGMIKEIKPDILVVVDALAARSADRLNKTIQLSDTGIAPGSGVGNHRAAIMKETMGIPVIGIGVPTVISVPSIVDAAMDTMVNALGKSGMNQVLGELDENQRYALAKEMLTPQLAEMFVTPKNVDDAVKRISYTISEAFNQMLGLQPEVLAYIQ